MALPLPEIYRMSSTRRPVIYTVAPALASSRAIPFPTPRLAPVTRATCPSSLCIKTSRLNLRAPQRSRRSHLHSPNCVSDSTLPSGSLNHATFATLGDVETHDSSCLSHSYGSTLTFLSIRFFFFDCLSY